MCLHSVCCSGICACVSRRIEVGVRVQSVQASNIAMKAGLQCAYTNVDDATCVEAFTAVGLQAWIAKGNVEMLAFIRGGK